MNPARYRPPAPFSLPDRTWPQRTQAVAPRWCSVDLRDGNQALASPMGVETRLAFFETLVKAGFKEIEVGFPAASQVDFDFVRRLIVEGRIPEDVTIQVMTQAREALIARTVEALEGAGRAILHLSSPTSVLHRRVVFGMEPAAMKALALRGTAWVREAVGGRPWRFEFGLEGFTGTEMEFAAEVADAVVEAWGPGEQVVLNLPASVELAGPHRYADQIEWMHRNLRRREQVILSVHAHNDRGCAVAATELALLAGAERVEGTLFGNGERTGNADLVTLALNLFAQGVDPCLELGDLPALVEAFEGFTGLPVHPRHPYAGALAFAAFSGTHQDAIRKGLAAQVQAMPWEVPYLPIDPADVGRRHEAVIRINSQSGKSGVAHVLEQAWGCAPDGATVAAFSRVVQRLTEATGKELGQEELLRAFRGNSPGFFEINGKE